MGKFKIYIHGRPQGQDVWPQYETTNDRFYIEPFLDSTIGGDVNSSLITDIYQNCTYYTYIHRKNVVEKVARGRAGTSYFALTIRFDNTICRNVNTLYNLLNQVYEQICIGNIIRNEDGIKHYLISRFEEKQTIANQIISVIGQNIEKVLSPSIVSLGKAKDTMDSVAKDYALVDVDSPSFMEDIVRHKLLISPEKESKDEKYSSLFRKVKPIQEKCDSLADELTKMRQTATTLKERNDALQRNIQSVEEEKRLLEIKLSDATSTIETEYKEQLQAKDVQIKNALEEKDKQAKLLTDAQKENTALKKKLQAGGQNKEIIQSFEQIKEPLITFSRQVASRFPEGGGGNGGVIPQTPKTSFSLGKFKDWFLVGNFVLLICLFGFNYHWHSLNNNSSKDTDITPPTEVNGKPSDSAEGGISSISPTPTTKEDTPNPQIDLAEYNGQGPLIQGKTYTLSVQNSPGEGEYVINGSTLNGNKFTVGSSDNVNISYMYNGQCVAERSFTTKK